MGGEYIGARRNVKLISRSVEPVVSKALEFEESQANKLKMIQRGNQKSVFNRPEVIEKSSTRRTGILV